MSKILSGVSAIVLSALALSHPAVAETKTITFLFTDDDQSYVEHMAALSKQFEAAHPDVKVNFVSSGYDAVAKQLPVQLAVGEGPDLAKITDWQLAPFFLDMRPYMKDPDGYAKLHGESLNQLRLPGVNDPQSINGYVASQTLNLPFVNKTLFEQAEEPLPGPKATLKEIVEASARVAKKTGVQIPFTMDRSGHRFSGAAFSYGSSYVKDGKFSFPDEAAKTYIADLYNWTKDGSFPKEMWGAAGGSQYKNMGDEFVNGNVVTYLAGNWMVNPFQKKIGDAFEWTAINAPCGTAGCYAMPGATAIAGFKRTKYPEAVAQFIEFLGSEKVQREIAENYVILTGAEIDKPQYKLTDDNAKASMAVFNDNEKNVPQEARIFEKKKGGSALYQQIVQRMSQLIVGELTLQQTYDALAADIDKINVATATK
ncbi:carbohydrate ABC transporter substrate-binding protein [Agrobacterium vitis]|uniref:Carbohydrate ABC transporter substrate-binding protein n=1 Tax=Agrobacterium vitis TaxID=373 RepID=A0A368P122_AGRVI|nr:ABC transporter substrate-binding protein [Agrobacterium vitis]KAA3518667.1 carbohydrate ABC transporter substrate-binding protein [Agrobacterium vitis]KAA3530264.1 carbohydrate ABC transporter substrate-binding protein [Agrobacterium vitis]MCF1476340.1 carbohydrate ABC transporter substrate-binding protein [Agrobacterium vitis]MUZ96465.1 extracellular solute-binding protein [Agrobacterium vitis]MVA30230.1 extracellular solute-binding protein [Agrobacterium vitis]